MLSPSLMCRVLLLFTKSQFETGDCTHFDLLQLYSRVSIFPGTWDIYSQNIWTLVQPNILFSILSLYTVLFPSLLCLRRFCVRNLSSKLVTAHTLIYSNYIHKCASSLVAVAQCECARPCTRSHMYAHLKRTNHPSMQYSAGHLELGMPGVPCPRPLCYCFFLCLAKVSLSHMLRMGLNAD